MIPHLGFSKGKAQNDERARDFYRPALRQIEKDWGQFRGPNRNGHIPTQTVSIDWTKPPKTRWSTPCGLGHSSIITSGKLAITMEQDQDQEILIARSFDDGQEAWRVAEKTKWHDMLSGTGPRSTPTLHNGKLYTLFSHGKLSRVDANSGNVEWSIQVTPESYEFPEWGLAISPLIWNDMIILSLGGEVSAVKAYSIKSGKKVWQSEVAGKAVYLSPEVLRLLDEDHLIVSLVGKIVSLDPKNGKTLWEKPWKIFMNNAQIVQPIAVSNDSILLAAGYGKGAECFTIARDEESEKYRVQSSWKSKDLKAKFSGAADKKTLIKFGIGFGAIIIFLIIYYAILNPMVKERKAKYEDKLLKENEISQFENEIIQFKARIKKLKPEFEESSTLFHSKAEVEDLYQSLSRHAGVNGLVISKIEKKKPIAVMKAGIAEQSENNLTQDMVSYYKIPVDFEIKGKFLGYIKFKRAVSKQKKMLNFDKETISIVQNDSTGAIIATGELTIVGLPNEFF